MFDWQQLESTIADVAENAVVSWMKKNPSQLAYAFAFHECYRELDGVITIPQLGVNSIQETTVNDDDEDEGWKWNSADWHWLNILPARSSLAKLEAKLTTEACRSTQTHWLKCEKRFHSILVRVAKLLYRKFAEHAQTTDDFFVYIDDEGGDIETIRRTIPAKLFTKHFAKFEKPSLDAHGISPKELLAKYLDEIYTYENEILAFGQEAIDPLIQKLDDPTDGWAAAGLLADLNQPTKAVISALRKHTSAHTGMAEFCSMALFSLGDVEFLFSLVGNEKTRCHAIMGITNGLKVGDSKHKPPIPLDYRHVERLLALNSAKIKKQVSKELAPGSSFIEIAESDLEELLRGLSTPHAVIRQHAACVSDRRALGAKVGKILLPILADKLNDPVANVRRLALLSLSYSKAAAKPYHPQMKRLQKDSDANVREIARYVFQ